MTRYILLLICLITSNSLYSQTGYPRQIVYNGDTVVAITRHQVEMLNIAHQTWVGCTQENDSLTTTIDTCTAGFHYADSVIAIQHSIILADGIYITQQSSVVDTLKSVIADQKRVIKRLRVQRALSATLSTALVVVIGYLLLR